MKKYLFLLLTFCALGIYAQTQTPEHIPARHRMIPRIQPDGDTLYTFLRGDERSHYTMTVDGWQILEDKNGKFCYATLKTRRINGERQQVAVVTRRTAHDAEKRSKCEQRWLDRHGIQKRSNN